MVGCAESKADRVKELALPWAEVLIRQHDRFPELRGFLGHKSDRETELLIGTSGMRTPAERNPAVTPLLQICREIRGVSEIATIASLPIRSIDRSAPALKGIEPEDGFN